MCDQYDEPVDPGQPAKTGCWALVLPAHPGMLLFHGNMDRAKPPYHVGNLDDLLNRQKLVHSSGDGDPGPEVRFAAAIWNSLQKGTPLEVVIKRVFFEMHETGEPWNAQSIQ